MLSTARSTRRPRLLLAALLASPLACGVQSFSAGSSAVTDAAQTTGGQEVGSSQSGLISGGTDENGTGTTAGSESAGSETGTNGTGGTNVSSGGSSQESNAVASTGGGNSSSSGGTDASNANAVDTGARTFTFGAIIDYDGAGPHGKQSVASFVSNTKIVPDLVDSYVRLKNDGTFELDTAKTLINQAAASKVPTVCLSVTSEVTSNTLPSSQLASLVSAVTYGKSVGVAIQIRFAYEMNGYWSPAYNGGNPARFLSQWAQVAPAVQKAGGKMMWSPNVPFDTNSALARWLPSDASTIDLVGMDYYPKTNPLTVATVRDALSKIYDTARKLNKPLYFGETAAVYSSSSVNENATEAANKVTWLKALTDSGLRDEMPLYSGFRWFDYEKYEDNAWNNWSVSADPYAASAFTTWYKTSVFVTGN